MRYIFTSYLCTVKSNFSYPSLVGSPESLNCRYSSNAYLSWERIKERFRSLSLCSRFPKVFETIHCNSRKHLDYHWRESVGI